MSRRKVSSSTLSIWKNGTEDVPLGEEAKPIVTNSPHLASIIELASCRSCKEVAETLEKEVRGSNWKSAVAGFEQDMKEEDEVRVDWSNGKYESSRMVCESCGDYNAWDKTHTCCEQQCKGVLNALHAFPFAAWDDISGRKTRPR